MKRRRNDKHSFTDLWGIIITGLGIFLLLSLISYRPNDISYYMVPPNTPPHNYMGASGAWAAFVLYFLFGLSAYIIPAFTILYGILKAGKLPLKKRPDIYIFAWCLILISAGGLISLISGGGYSGIEQKLKLVNAGGLIGLIISGQITIRYFGRIGSALIMGSILIISLIYITEIRFWLAVKTLGSTSFRLLYNSCRFILCTVGNTVLSAVTLLKAAGHTVRAKTPAPAIRDSAELPGTTLPAKKTAPPAPHPAKKEIPQKEVKLPLYKGEKSKYTLPPVDILEPPPPSVQRVSNETLSQNAKILEKSFYEFGINVKVTSIQKGPVVTMYELTLAPGTKIGKITALSDDIALAMRTGSVRIIAPIPGKSAIGIEVPNTKPRFVYLKDVIASPAFQNSEAKIPLALGMDVSGIPLICDLTTMPHLLIAGTTGSGKTVCLNAIILSVLARLGPDEVKFLMVDPKMVELSVYKHLPHMLIPVIHDPKKASLGLVWVVREMERRYELFAYMGVRNIEGYNNRPQSGVYAGELPSIEEGLLEIDYKASPPPKLPYIVIVIDELADLMIAAPADIETAIGRLAQLSRAVGIHIILATQRPSVDVLTGVIKANFSTRISFQVASRIDSRTVLDTNGADMLLGKGDMLFMPPGSSKLIRGQCTLVRDIEISRIVNFIVSQKKADFSSGCAKDAVFQKLKKVKAGAEKEDPLFEDAVDVILTSRQASVSILQRKLRIGYNRAARIVDMMEERGIVGPIEDGKREILADRYKQLTADG